AYGVEFSPDGTKLYGTVITPGYIYQWDVSLATDDEIKASKILVGTSAVNFNGAVQLASDGKIYLAELSSPWLGVFNFPDLAGVACNFVDQGFQLSTGSNGLGLPNYFPCLFAPNNPSPDPQFTASSPDICQKFCIDYFDASSNDPTSWLWEFEGGSPATSTTQNPTGICYSVPGVFDVKLTATNANGSNTITLTDYITVYATPPFPSISQVGYTLTSSAATAYQWQLNSIDIPGATNQSYIVTQTGFYTVVITDENGCVSSTTLYVLITGIENVFGGNEISISPNPSNGNFTIDFGNENILGEVSINLVNAIGQTIFSTQEFIPSFQKEIQLNNVTDGIYFIEIISNTFSLQKKIIVTR
ncbi:MAG: PKD domain-containing protein, partial [Chitinophagales bacterium]|nr:PKD domain-containing protein [Chitinophagales bacterium]